MRIRGYITLLAVLALTALDGRAGEAEAVLVDLVRAEYGLTEPEFEIEVLANRLETEELDPAQIKFRPLTQKDPIGLFTIWVDVLRAGDIVDRGQVRFRITRYADVLVSVDKIARHEELRGDQFELVRSDVTNLYERPITDKAELIGARAKRNLQRGTLLTSGAIEAIPDIKLGGDVTIAYTDDWGVITAPGRALEAGWIGHEVRVKNLATGKVVRGTVTAGDAVEVNP